jgi:hypothetical protein
MNGFPPGVVVVSGCAILVLFTPDAALHSQFVLCATSQIMFSGFSLLQLVLALQCSVAFRTPLHARLIHATPCGQTPAPVLMGAKSNWSIGKARKRGKSSQATPARSAAKGFGMAPSSPQSAAQAPTVDSSGTALAPADLNENDLQAAAAAAGGDTWRAYADAAMAQVAQLCAAGAHTIGHARATHSRDCLEDRSRALQ